MFIFIICVFLLLLLISRMGGEDVPAVAEPLYQGNADKKEMALACNVFWGEEYIGPMLEILTEKDVKITFFIGAPGRRSSLNWLRKYKTGATK